MFRLIDIFFTCWTTLSLYVIPAQEIITPCSNKHHVPKGHLCVGVLLGITSSLSPPATGGVRKRTTGWDCDVLWSIEPHWWPMEIIEAENETPRNAIIPISFTPDGDYSTVLTELRIKSTLHERMKRSMSIWWIILKGKFN